MPRAIGEKETPLPASPRVRREECAFRISELRDAIKPFRLHWFPTLHSTNDHAAELRKRNELFAPAIVLTGRQTAGRGRGDHTWWSSGGCLTITFALPISEHIEPQQLPLIAGLAVRDALVSFCDSAQQQHIQLKWPNDLLVDGRKLAGLLCERVRKVDLIGVGVNVNVRRSEIPKALRSTVASLSDCARKPISMNEFVITLSDRILARLTRPGDHHFPTVLSEYDSHHALIGRRVRVTDSVDAKTISGKCVGLDDVGRLLLKDGKTVHRVIAGHVRIV